MTNFEPGLRSYADGNRATIVVNALAHHGIDVDRLYRKANANGFAFALDLDAKDPAGYRVIAEKASEGWGAAHEFMRQAFEDAKAQEVNHD